METKVCPKCNKEKPIKEFYKDKANKNGLNSWCKECTKEHNKEYYQENKEEAKAYTLKRLREHQNWIDKIKLERGCKICGYNEHPAALEFHHRNPDEKEFIIGQHILRSKENLLKEIEKCDVLCANHHNILHSRRR